jgi:serine/threonine protein kinase
MSHLQGTSNDAHGCSNPIPFSQNELTGNLESSATNTITNGGQYHQHSLHASWSPTHDSNPLQFLPQNHTAISSDYNSSLDGDTAYAIPHRPTSDTQIPIDTPALFPKANNNFNTVDNYPNIDHILQTQGDYWNTMGDTGHGMVSQCAKSPLGKHRREEAQQFDALSIPKKTCLSQSSLSQSSCFQSAPISDELTETQIRACKKWLQQVKCWPNDETFEKVARTMRANLKSIYGWAFEYVIRKQIEFDLSSISARCHNMKEFSKTQVDFFISWLETLEEWPDDLRLSEFASITTNESLDLVLKLAYQMLLHPEIDVTVQAIESIETEPSLLATTPCKKSESINQFLPVFKLPAPCSPTKDISLLGRDDAKPIQCTFACGKRYRTSRGVQCKNHEARHFPQRTYVCLASFVDLTTKCCKICGMANVDASHVYENVDHQMNGNGTCFAGGFLRKDHLKQHYENSHGKMRSKDYEILTSSLAEFPLRSQVPKWCGFCVANVSYAGDQVKARFAHMKSHFINENKCMRDWISNTGALQNDEDLSDDGSFSDDPDQHDSSDGSDSEDDDHRGDRGQTLKKKPLKSNQKHHSDENSMYRKRTVEDCELNNKTMNRLEAGQLQLEFILELPGLTAKSSTASIQEDSQYNVLNEFQIVDLLGTGGSSKVYKLVHRQTRFQIAMKQITSTSSEEKFQSEVRMLRRFNHPYIVELLNLPNTAQNLIFLYPAADYTLRTYFHCSVRELLLDLLISLHETTSALAHIHQNFALHGDIKPENILVYNLKGRTQFLIGDLGAARFECSEANYSKEIPITPKYCPPEVFETRRYSRRSDIYSLGIVLLEIFLHYEGLDYWRLINCLKDSPQKSYNVAPEEALFLSELLNRKNKSSLAIFEGISLCLSRDPRLRPSAFQLQCAILSDCNIKSTPQEALLSSSASQKQTEVPLKSVSATQNKSLVTILEADWSPLISWLSTCNNTHTDCGHSRKHKITKPLRLFDCHERKLIVAFDRKYAALSYCWGDVWKSKVMFGQVWSEYARFSSKLPQIIEDAISVTQKLGLRYLWIDQLCINPFDTEDIHRHLLQIGDIYSNAFVAIIFLGEISNQTKSPTNLQRDSSEISHLLNGVGSWIVPTRLRAIELIELSAWHRRGWTLQETVLSRRSVYFTNQDILWTCSSAEEEEIGIFQSFPKSQITEWDLANSVRGIYHYIKLYSQRELTDPGEKIYAILGLLQTSEVNGSKMNHVMGIPIIPLYAETKEWYDPSMLAFVLGMCWDTALPHSFERCRRFPSWSWAGWIAELGDWTWEMSAAKFISIEYLRNFRTSVNIVFELFNGSLIDWSALMLRHTHSEASLSTQAMHISGWVSKGSCRQATQHEHFNLMHFQFQTTETDCLNFRMAFIPHHRNFDHDRCLAIHLLEGGEPYSVTWLIASEVNGRLERIGLLMYKHDEIMNELCSCRKSENKEHPHISIVERKWDTLVLL